MYLSSLEAFLRVLGVYEVPSARVCMGTIQRDVHVGVGGRVHLLLACVNLQVVLHNWTGKLNDVKLEKQSYIS